MQNHPPRPRSCAPPAAILVAERSRKECGSKVEGSQPQKGSGVFLGQNTGATAQGVVQAVLRGA
eukprot:6656786-Pyramimonas_sp.AAC.1